VCIFWSVDITFLPGTAPFIDACTIFNPFPQAVPCAVVRVAQVSQVQQLLPFLQGLNCVLTVRSGGHSPSGSSLSHGGIVLDVRQLRHVVVDAAQSTVSVGAGALWRSINATTCPMNLAAVGGSCADVAVGGFVLGGGFGYLRSASVGCKI
jgi:FAD/FMN-containing dehydrogenase